MRAVVRAPSLAVGLLLLGVAGCAPRAVAAPPETAASTAEDRFSLLQVTDQLWRYTVGNYHGVLLDTDEGIVVTDPLSTEAATWLRAEVARRFDKPIVYVLYSHNHPDHAYGGQALDGPDTRFVAQRLAARDWRRTRARVRMPDLEFDQALTLHVGGQTIELRHHGRNNGLGSVSMRFVEQGVVHVVDWIVVGRVPYDDLRGYDINGMLDSTRQVLGLDFEVFVGGHADLGDRAGVERYLAYLESLHAQVLDGILAGEDLQAVQARVDLSDFEDLKAYDRWKDRNVEGVYRQLLDISYLDMRPEVE